MNYKIAAVCLLVSVMLLGCQPEKPAPESSDAEPSQTFTTTQSESSDQTLPLAIPDATTAPAVQEETTNTQNEAPTTEAAPEKTNVPTDAADATAAGEATAATTVTEKTTQGAKPTMAGGNEPIELPFVPVV